MADEWPREDTEDTKEELVFPLFVSFPFFEELIQNETQRRSIRVEEPYIPAGSLARKSTE